jgi:16S rRNA (guanine966-N2)-methyltransferase
MNGLSNQVRIIGGRWRGRRLHFPPLEGLRPTPDRVRETLFNWLAPVIEGARCLDLFAGSGALGIEALSRGAAKVVFVERHPLAVRKLRENLALLGIDSVPVVKADALTWLKGRSQPFDIVLLDPPFGGNLLEPVCAVLEQGGWLATQARIYLETEKAPQNPELPQNWTIIRDKTAGQVSYRLAVRKA